jgi:hypothetical protein
VIKVLDTMSSAELNTLLNVAVQTADNKEIELSGDFDER